MWAWTEKNASLFVWYSSKKWDATVWTNDSKRWILMHDRDRNIAELSLFPEVLSSHLAIGYLVTCPVEKQTHLGEGRCQEERTVKMHIITVYIILEQKKRGKRVYFILKMDVASGHIPRSGWKIALAKPLSSLLLTPEMFSWIIIINTIWQQHKSRTFKAQSVTVIQE